MLAGDPTRFLRGEQIDTAYGQPPLLVAVKLILDNPGPLAARANTNAETAQLLVKEDCILLASG
jgi:hypothetical protein